MLESNGLGDEEQRELENILLENPWKGAVIEGLAGIRKLRIKPEGRGKSGSGRVIYPDFPEKESCIFFSLIQRAYRRICLLNSVGYSDGWLRL